MDGDSGTIKYHLMVKDWNKPVEWTYEVLKQGKTIYSKLSNDKLIDSLFNDDNYYRSDKGGYSENKRSWYLNGITKIHCDTILPGDKRRSEFKDYSRKLLLSDYGENSEDQLKNWDSFWNHNPNKSILVFIFSDAPESDKPLLAYHWKLKRFVQIYTP